MEPPSSPSPKPWLKWICLCLQCGNGYCSFGKPSAVKFSMPLRRLHQPVSGIPARSRKPIITIPAGAIVEVADGLQTMSAIVVVWNGRRITVCSQHVEKNSEPVSVWKSENKSHRRMILTPDTPIDGFDPRPDNAGANVGRGSSHQMCG